MLSWQVIRRTLFYINQNRQNIFPKPDTFQITHRISNDPAIHVTVPTNQWPDQLFAKKLSQATSRCDTVCTKTQHFGHRLHRQGLISIAGCTIDSPWTFRILCKVTLPLGFLRFDVQATVHSWHTYLRIIIIRALLSLNSVLSSWIIQDRSSYCHLQFCRQYTHLTPFRQTDRHDEANRHVSQFYERA